MIKSIFKLFFLFTIIGFMSISPKSRNFIGTSLEYVSQFLLFTVNDENKNKWIIDKPNWLMRDKIEPSY